MEIHITRTGERFGPYTLEEIKERLANGTLKLTDLAFYSGGSGWVALSKVPGVNNDSAESPAEITMLQTPKNSASIGGRSWRVPLIIAAGTAVSIFVGVWFVSQSESPTGKRVKLALQLQWAKIGAALGDEDSAKAVAAYYIMKEFREGQSAASTGTQSALDEIRKAEDATDSSNQQSISLRTDSDNPADAEAQYRLAQAFLRGDDRSIDPKQARYWMDKAAGQNHLFAKAHLAILLASESGGPTDAARSSSLGESIVSEIERLAQAGNAEAQRLCGLIAIEGIGGSKDVDKGHQLLRKAAEKGDVWAQSKLGLIYLAGEGVPKDESKGAALLMKAASQGDPTAQTVVGRLLILGQGVPKHEEQAFEWTKKAAERGVVEAQRRLGSMLFDGKGVPKNERQAVKWLEKAGEQGDFLAQTLLGVALLDGVGVPRDEQKASEWFTKAAEQGYASAQVRLGEMFLKGTGVQVNISKGVEWLTKAAEQGESTAQTVLGFLLLKGEEVPRDEQRALELLTKAAEQGHSGAKRLLTEMNERLLGVFRFRGPLLYKGVAIPHETQTMTYDLRSDGSFTFERTSTVDGGFFDVNKKGTWKQEGAFVVLTLGEAEFQRFQPEGSDLIAKDGARFIRVR